MTAPAAVITTDDLDSWLAGETAKPAPVPLSLGSDDAGQIEDAREYLSKMDAAVSGQGGHAKLLAAARTLIHDFGLTEASAACLLQEYSGRCDPPWEQHELDHKIRQAQKLSASGDCEHPYRSKGRKADMGYTIIPPSRSRKPEPVTSALPTPAAPAGVTWTVPKSEHPAPPAYNVLTLDEILNFDTTEDPNCLIGDRWLCKGGSLGIVGQTGIGKSSLTMQFATSMALGMPLFGITPKRALSSVIIQAENDIGDVHEELRGVISGLGAEEQLPALSKRLSIIHEAVKMSKAFADLARQVAHDLKPDMIIVDPWFAFMGCDSSDQEKISQFLRGWLNPIAQETGIAWVIIHHTPKPRAEKPGREINVADFSYFGAGSAEFSNWCRAMMVLRETGGRYELRSAKRGKRSGLCEKNGKPAQAVNLQHAKDKIFWEYADETMEEKMERVVQKRKVQDREQTIIQLMGSRGWMRNELERHAAEACSVTPKTIGRALDTMMEKLDRNALGQYSVKKEFRVAAAEARVVSPEPEEDELAF